MPGGSGAVRDGLAILLPVLEHACETIAGPVDHG
jgi:molybdopterin biosynthesis enzyme MoaB